jgi:hypothetical protein
MSMSDMDCSDEEGGTKPNIEMNVKIPQMKPRIINRQTKPRPVKAKMGIAPVGQRTRPAGVFQAALRAAVPNNTLGQSSPKPAVKVNR